MKDAHGASFAVMPDARGKNKIFIVDGTPDGVEGVSSISLEEKERKADEDIERIKKEADEELEEIMKIIKSKDADAIRKLKNGELEKILNAVLKYEVKIPHLKTLERVLNGYWYTPIKDLDLSEIENKVQFLKFFEEEIKAIREEEKDLKLDKSAGEFLFDTIENFSKRFLKSGKTESQGKAFDLLEDIIDINKDNLNEIERRAAAAVITYLRGRGIVGKKE